SSHTHPWNQITGVPTASLTAKGITQLSSATNSTSEVLAATPKAVKAAYDLANGKYTAQDATTTQKGIVQLSSATNSTSETLAATPKAVKAVMDETSKKAPLNSPALTGTPTTPTAPQGTNSTQIASTAFVMAAIAALVDSSPDALNTLNELAAALGNDPNFATTMTNALAGKQPKDATLTALAELATSADKLPYFTGADRAALTALTSVGRAILGKTSTQGVLDYLGLGEGSALPVGVPVPWPSATPPTGWLKCNGAAFSAEEYPELAKAYPTNILPDLRGEFIRGWDDGRGVDSSRTLLSWQKGSYLVQEANISPDSVVQFSVNDIALLGWDKTETNSDIIRAKSIPTEHIWNPVPVGDWGIQYLGYARPRNIAFNYIVRAA
ncbi:tail fiber protein, partial [Escherichia coli]|nr:tail fiber protein [Escherichia coli]